MKNKVAVIYKSKYGSTKRYAGWIALKVGADLYEIRDIRSKDLDKYNTIIYGGGIYVGKISGIKFINKNYQRIKDKKIIVFTVGLESSEENFKTLLERNFDKEQIENTKVFKLRGAFDYSKLNLIDKALMKGLKATINKKSIFDLTDDDKVVLEGFERKIDLCDKKAIKSLIECI